MRSLPTEPKILFLQPPQTVPKEALDALHSFNVSTTALAILGALRSHGYADCRFYDIACEEGDSLHPWNDHLFWKGVPLPDVKWRLEGERPDVVLVTSMFTCDTPLVNALLVGVREALPEACIIVGGRHASLMPHWHLDTGAVDFLVQGEGEDTIVELLDHLSGRRVRLGGPSSIPGVLTRATLGKTQPPERWRDALLGGEFAWDEVLWKPDGSWRYREVVLEGSPKDPLYKQSAIALHSAPLLPTRGCPLRCRFCGSHFNSDMRFVGMERLVEDFEHCYDRGVRIFYNISENFALSPKDKVFLAHLAELRDQRRGTPGGDFSFTNPNSSFLPLYLKRNGEPDAEFISTLQRAGASLVTISLETTSPRFDDKRLFQRYKVEWIDRLWAYLHGQGIAVHIYMMSGFPGQTLADLRGDVERVGGWLRAGLIDAASWSNLIYIPGTQYFDDAIAKGRFDEARYRSWIDEGFNFFAVNERFNFTEIETPVLKEIVAHLRRGDYDIPALREHRSPRPQGEAAAG